MTQPAVILGGGISGLATAYYLTKLPAIKRIILVDKKARLGGWIQSTRYPCGTVDEHGPHSIRTAGVQGANTLKLIEELGLQNEIIPVHPKTLRGRLIYYNKELVWLPGSIKDAFKIRKPFTTPLVFPAISELFKPAKAIEDESLHSFFQRRFNGEIADYLIDPMCRGICAGNSKEISVRSLLPSVYHAEQKFGSVVRGMMKPTEQTEQCTLHSRSRQENWGAFSFRQGLQTLVDSLVERISNDRRVTIYENEDNVHLSEDNGTFTVHYAEGDTTSHHLFSCIPAKALSRLMSRVDPRMSTALMEIPLAHVVSCTLEFEGHHLKHQAFGYLVPSSQQSRVLGVIFDSACFPQHDGQFAKKTRVTCLMGGRWFAEHFGDIKKLDPKVYTDAAIEACEQHLGIKAKPLRDLTNVLPNCIPQYQVGHYNTINRLKEFISQRGFEMSLLGSSYEGLSVNDCIFNARLAVERYASAKNLQ